MVSNLNSVQSRFAHNVAGIIEVRITGWEGDIRHEERDGREVELVLPADRAGTGRFTLSARGPGILFCHWEGNAPTTGYFLTVVLPRNSQGIAVTRL